jgi:hypothetical protein
MTGFGGPPGPKIVAVAHDIPTGMIPYWTRLLLSASSSK